MKLKDALDQIESLDDGHVIFARRPWSLDAEAEVGLPDAEFRVPKGVVSRGLDYFLEVHVAREVLEVFGNQSPTLDQRRALLMFYAENDAYPSWVYDDR